MRVQVVLPITSDPDHAAKRDIWITAARRLNHELRLPDSQTTLRKFNLDESLAEMSIVDLLVADLSFERPSCYYELGLGQALRLPTVILYNTDSHLLQHADARAYFRYGDLLEYEEAVEKALSLDHPSANSVHFVCEEFTLERQSPPGDVIGVKPHWHVLRRPAVSIVLIDERQRILFTREFRSASDTEAWRLPTGRIESSDQDEVMAARRELLEELGVSITELAPLAEWRSHSGLTRYRISFFFGSVDSRHVRITPSAELLGCEWVPRTRAENWACSGKIDSAYAFALDRAFRYSDE